MSAVRCYAMWRLKDGVEIEKENLNYFSPGGFTFTHKSGKHICFDFEESSTSYIHEDRLIDSDLREIDNEHITDSLKQDGYNDLIQEQYDIEFFRDGKIDLSNDFDEIYCCMDITINGELQTDVDFKEYIEPVYLSVFNPYSKNEDSIELYNNLTPEEHREYYE